MRSRIASAVRGPPSARVRRPHDVLDHRRPPYAVRRPHVAVPGLTLQREVGHRQARSVRRTTSSTAAGDHADPRRAADTLATVHPLLRAAAERQAGLFTSADARRAGHGHDEIRALCSAGTWVRLRRGVFTTAELAATPAGRSHATACLAVQLSLDRPTAVISHGSAARLHGWPVWTGLDRTVRLTDPAQWRSRPGYRMACAPLPPEHVWERGPYRLTSAARTLVDCAREWPLEDAVVAMDAALLAGATTSAGLRQVATSQQSWRGATQARRAVDLADGRAESPLETLGRLRLVGAELAPDELQVEIRAEGKVVAVVDAWYEESGQVHRSVAGRRSGAVGREAARGRAPRARHRRRPPHQGARGSRLAARRGAPAPGPVTSASRGPALHGHTPDGGSSPVGVTDHSPWCPTSRCRVRSGTTRGGRVRGPG
ncbi:type IV toxin-antitoxin system AbiEi family antitoxin domain-containing protein [Geodermatophilus sp. YIM 151500]|uniref:type IV toxin-antitoxin system AbiEi family antitoxin domain-containing protein n=1 Tax=Geodermatophilus sp. YIM 151500 TaxID=2984531 RepID=UPI00398CEED9